MLSSIQKKNSFVPKDFVIGRLVRIVPVYWIATTIFIALVAVMRIRLNGLDSTLADPQFSPAYILSSFLLLPAFNQTTNAVQPFLAQGWTLSYELYFYLLLMCAAMLGKRNAFKTAVFGTAFLASGMLVFWTARGVAGSFLSNSLLLEFALGMMVYLITRHTKAFATPATMLGFALLAATMFVKVEYRVIEWGIPSALILYGFVSLEGVLSAPRLLKAIGDASYSLYLTHSMLTYIYGGLLRRGLFTSATAQDLAVLGGTTAAVFLAFVFYRFVEKPLLARMSPKRLAVQPVIVSSNL